MVQVGYDNDNDDLIRGVYDNDKVTHVCCNNYDVMRGIWDIDNVVGTGCWASCFEHGLLGFVLWTRSIWFRVVGTSCDTSCGRHIL